MAHFYIDNQRFTEDHPLWPKTKSGKPSKRPTLEQIEQAGACVGVTDSIKMVENTGWMPKYFGDLGISAGLLCNSYDNAKELFDQTSIEAAERGTEFHDAIERYLWKGEEPDDSIILNACRGIDEFLFTHEILPDECKLEHCITHDMLTCGGVVVSYGGTMDLCSDKFIVDWKTVNKPRKPYKKELLQLVAYSKGNLDKRMINLYIDSGTGKVINEYEWSMEQKHFGWRLFQDVMMMNKRLRELDKMI
ncbi:hypothetical protein EOL73_00295 [Candidatus Saccharibacteria bacterium]|nr:hypothetical protein [Candidatus Saccharibacteria bacterium]